MSPKKPTRKPHELKSVQAALVDFLGEARVEVSTDLPNVLVASATSIAEVQGALAVARQHKTPLLPRAGHIDTLALRAPEQGGILLNLSGMNRILEVNHSERYAVIEPGVTWRQLARRLVEDGGDLAVPTAAAPEGLSVWASSLMDGAGGLSLAHGALGELVWGVEAVLTSGELVRTGVGSVTEAWWGRGPLPDLTGLFLGWRGATGLVTRLAVSLRPRRRHLRRLLIPATTRRVAIAAGIRLAREGLFDETSVLPWNLPRLLLGVDGNAGRHASEPEAFLHVDFTADTRPELEYKRLRLANALSRASRRGGHFDEPMTLASLASMSTRLMGLGDLPLRLALSGPDDQLSVLGCYGPTSKLVDGAQRIEEAYQHSGLMPTLLVHPVRGGHFGVLHAVVRGEPGRDSDPDHPVRSAQARALDNLVGLGFLPHRYPPDLATMIFARMHPGSQRLALRLKRLLDPEAILDPGKWGLPVPA